MKFILFSLGICGATFGGAYAEGPAHDGRIQREQYVSSLIKPGDVGAEIGVQMGQFAYYTLLQGKPSKLYLIDPWQLGVQGYGDPSLALTKPNGRNPEYEGVCKLFAPYPNVKILKMKSDDAVTLFQDRYFDYVYIDGEHSYAAVMRDLTNYFPKVKVGGLIIGDDYGWSGVGQAVQEFCMIHQKELIFQGDPYRAGTGGQFAIRKIK